MCECPPFFYSVSLSVCLCVCLPVHSFVRHSGTSVGLPKADFSRVYIIIYFFLLAMQKTFACVVHNNIPWQKFFIVTSSLPDNLRLMILHHFISNHFSFMWGQWTRVGM